MAETRIEYNETMEYIISRGLWGPVEDIDHNYKNVGATSPLPTPDIPTSIPQNVKTQNESPASSFLLTGRASSPISEVR